MNGLWQYSSISGAWWVAGGLCFAQLGKHHTEAVAQGLAKAKGAGKATEGLSVALAEPNQQSLLGTNKLHSINGEMRIVRPAGVVVDPTVGKLHLQDPRSRIRIHPKLHPATGVSNLINRD